MRSQNESSWLLRRSGIETDPLNPSIGPKPSSAKHAGPPSARLHQCLIGEGSYIRALHPGQAVACGAAEAQGFRLLRFSLHALGHPNPSQGSVYRAQAMGELFETLDSGSSPCLGGWSLYKLGLRTEIVGLEIRDLGAFLTAGWTCSGPRASSLDGLYRLIAFRVWCIFRVLGLRPLNLTVRDVVTCFCLGHAGKSKPRGGTLRATCKLPVVLGWHLNKSFQKSFVSQGRAQRKAPSTLPKSQTCKLYYSV